MLIKWQPTDYQKFWKIINQDRKEDEEDLWRDYYTKLLT